MALIRDLSIYDIGYIPYGEYDGLVIRCYNGSEKDSKFETHKSGAIIVGKPWWAYAFYNFLYDPAPQVTAVMNILHDEPGALPVYWDVEEWGGHKYPPREQLLDNLKVLFNGVVNATGKMPGYYMNPATIHYLKPVPSWLLGCPLWVAHWGVNVPDFGPWARWTFHQYSGEPDYSSFNGSEAEYQAYVGGGTTPIILPDVVRVTAGVLNVRDAPGGNIVGRVRSGTLLGVSGIGHDANGDKWWQVGRDYVASWWTEDV